MGKGGGEGGGKRGLGAALSRFFAVSLNADEEEKKTPRRKQETRKLFPISYFLLKKRPSELENRICFPSLRTTAYC
jgi:hypothetical protein